MSGIFGIWNQNCEPVSRSILERMGARIEHRGGDGLEFWTKGGAGMGCHQRRVRPESTDERQPLIDKSGVLVFDGRLDDRAELLARFDRDENSSAISDSELVQMAWRRWREHFPSRLVGDFAIAAFDFEEQTLVLCRDPVGCRPLYYWSDGQRIVFASEIKSILEHPAVRAEPNLDLIADWLVLDHLPYEDEGETFFTGIRRVLPGHFLVATPTSLALARFWDFDPAIQIRHRAYSDYVLNLRQLLIKAVRRRLRSSYPVAITASGGLDSSIVLGIANQIRRKSPNLGIIAISYSPRSEADSEENSFLSLMEAETGIPIRRVEMGSAGDPAFLERTPWDSETPFFNDSWCAETPLLAAARDSGARVLLTGLWSDQLMFETGYLVDLWKRFAWSRVRRHLEQYQEWFPEADPADFRRRFYHELILNLTPASIRSFLRPFHTWSAGSKGRRSWVGEDFLRRARRRRARLKHPKYANVHARSVYQLVRSKSFRLFADADEMMSARSGLERVGPFLDRDVIAFLMAIPGEIQTRGGVPRGLLRDAVRGLIPGSIRQRRWRDEGTVSSRIEQDRAASYQRVKLEGLQCEGLGAVLPGSMPNEDFFNAMGLEYWLRVFFPQDSKEVSFKPSEVREAI